MDDDAEIKASLDHLVAAVSAKDVNGIMAVYLPDETLLVFDVVPPRQYVGAKACRKDWENFLSTLKGPAQIQISDLAVETDGKLGWGQNAEGEESKSRDRGVAGSWHSDDLSCWESR